MNDDFMKQILDIPALAEFNAEPAPTLDIEQRVLTFLAERHGPKWYVAHIAGNVLPNGTPIYTVFAPVGSPESGELDMRIVGENADGTLAEAAPVPMSDDEEDSGSLLSLPHVASEAEQEYLDMQACLARIFPALLEASDIVAASGRVKPKRKKRIRHELAHACEHLTMYLESLRHSA